MKNICVLGSGAWGTALGNLLASNGNRVRIYGICKEEIAEINSAHTNSRYFKKLKIDESIVASEDIDFAADGADFIVLAVPSFAIAQTARKILDKIKDGAVIVNVAKGFDPITKKPLGKIIREILSQKNAYVVSLLGPTFAEEVVEKQYSAIVASGEDASACERVQALFSNSYFRVYTSLDVVGAEYSAALKNVIALASGIVEGMGGKVNSRAAVITRGMAEIVRYVTHFGGDEKTCFGLTGVGDLVLTCSSLTSRNFSAGVVIGREGMQYFNENNKKTVEGIFACEIAYEIAKENNIYSPIVTAVYNVIKQKSSPTEEIKKLMTSNLKAE